jgi:hypothetical protein
VAMVPNSEPRMTVLASPAAVYPTQHDPRNQQAADGQFFGVSFFSLFFNSEDRGDISVLRVKGFAVTARPFYSWLPLQEAQISHC